MILADVVLYLYACIFEAFVSLYLFSVQIVSCCSFVRSFHHLFFPPPLFLPPRGILWTDVIVRLPSFYTDGDLTTWPTMHSDLMFLKSSTLFLSLSFYSFLFIQVLRSVKHILIPYCLTDVYSSLYFWSLLHLFYSFTF